MKRSPLNKPSAAAHVADPVGNNRLSDRPDWGELLRSLLPPSPVSAGSSPDAGQPHPEQSPPARSAAAADRSKRSGKAVQGRTAAASHRHSVLAVLLLGEAELFAGKSHPSATAVHMRIAANQCFCIVMLQATPLSCTRRRQESTGLQPCHSISRRTGSKRQRWTSRWTTPLPAAQRQLQGQAVGCACKTNNEFESLRDDVLW